MPKVTWDKEETELVPVVSRKRTQALKNLVKGRAVREENARKRNMLKIKEDQAKAKKEIESFHRAQMNEINKQTNAIATGMEDKMLEVAWNVAAGVGKRTLKELAKDAAWKVYEKAGGIDRHFKIVNEDDGSFIRHFRDVIVPLSKGDDGDASTRPIVRVNILGAPGGDVNVAMQVNTQPEKEAT